MNCGIENSHKRQKLVTNYPPLVDRISENSWCSTDYMLFRKQSIWQLLLDALHIRKNYDLLASYQDANILFFVVIFNALFPFKKISIASIDFQFSKHGKDVRSRIKGFLWKLIWSRVDIVIGHMHYHEDLLNHYGIKKSQYCYVPYKMNGYESLNSLPIHDGNYIFTGGFSWRDYETFCSAMAHVNYSAKIVTLNSNAALKHGTPVPHSNVPSNVEIIEHDRNPTTWREFVAGASIVVIPISKDSICANGISLCLSAMGMGKCVVITESPVVKNVFTNGQECVIVPIQDAQALSSAINHLLNDSTARNSIAERGRAFALSLGGTSELAERLENALKERFSIPQSSILEPRL